MLDFLSFFVSQFFNIFNVLDNMILFSNVSLLRLLFIIILFTIIIRFLMKGGGK